jgi:hypothetical protein
MVKEINLKAIGAYEMIEGHIKLLDKLIDSSLSVKELKAMRKEMEPYLENLKIEKDEALKFLRQSKILA